jgi:hypothetical protein
MGGTKIPIMENDTVVLELIFFLGHNKKGTLENFSKQDEGTQAESIIAIPATILYSIR